MIKSKKKGSDRLKFFEELGKAIEKTIKTENKKINVPEKIKNEEIELAQKLDAIEEYTIDRFEENMAVIEDINTGKIKNISQQLVPSEAKEGDIIKCINGKYFLDIEETKKVEKKIKEKYNNLWE